MFVVFDIGNTNIAAGLFDGDALVARVNANTPYKPASGEVPADIGDTFDAIVSQLGVDTSDIKAIAYANVVPALTPFCEEAFKRLCPGHVVVCNALTAQNFLPVKYPRPEEIGGDRIADAIALKSLYGVPGISVDLGTATNIEVLDAQGAFVGGIIIPGVRTSLDALFSHAAKLTPIELRAPQRAIGLSTEEAILSGAVFGEADRIDGLIERVIAELDAREEVHVIATGGLAPFIAPHSKYITVVDENLTLKGLCSFAQHVCL